MFWQISYQKQSKTKYSRNFFSFLLLLSNCLYLIFLKVLIFFENIKFVIFYLFSSFGLQLLIYVIFTIFVLSSKKYLSNRAPNTTSPSTKTAPASTRPTSTTLSTAWRSLLCWPAWAFVCSCCAWFNCPCRPSSYWKMPSSSSSLFSPFSFSRRDYTGNPLGNLTSS